MALIEHRFYELSAGDCSLVLFAPKFLHPLIDAALLGWRLIDSPPQEGADIVIRYDREKFLTDSLIYRRAIQRTDIVHALNDFFLTLAYLYTRSRPGLRLIHCSAYSDGRRNILLLGDKNSGKSFQAVLHGLTGGTLYADDLLLSNLGSGRFYVLGLPPRLRRPVHPDILELADPNCFLTGRDLVYIKTGCYAGAAVGTSVEFDVVRIFHAPQTHHAVPLRDYAKEISKRQIRDSFCEDKKPALDLDFG